MRLLHCADTHVGVETYGRIDPETGQHTRLTDFARCLDRAADQALEFGVDAVLFAGDAYRTATPTPTWQQVFAAFVRRFTEAGVPVVLVAGNHDLPVTFGRATSLDIFATFAPEQVTVRRRPELVRIGTRSGNLQVACLPWPTRSLFLADEAQGHADDMAIRSRLEERIRAKVEAMAAEADPALPTVLLGHVSVRDAVFSGSERMLLGSVDPLPTVGVVAQPQFDYVALGHIHRHQSLNDQRRPAVVYSGSTERIDFSEHAETKGVCLVEIGPGDSPAARQTTWRHAPLPARAFVALEYDLPAAAEPTAWLVEQLQAVAVAGAVVRVRYRCTDQQEQELDFREVRAALREAHYVAGLTRERPAEVRRPQVEISEDADTLDALNRYLDSRPELQPWREEVLASAREFDERLRQSESGVAATEN